MSNVGAPERVTQERIIQLFQEKLGYKYLGNWSQRENNQNIEVSYLKPFLQKQGYSDKLIGRALDKLHRTAKLTENLYKTNQEVYSLLRYGIVEKENVAENHKTVRLIDWKNPENNHFALAEEVTVRGQRTKRPDIVLYLNGIAIAVLELKSSTTSVSKGIGQNLFNQRRDFIRPFFTTIQLVMAGNDSQGLRYATIENEEKYYLEWKEEGGLGEYKLDRHLSLLCQKNRLLELIHNFIVFDAGTKKIGRHNQYFAVKNAQKYIHRREGGIIWHMQGSGKSLTMVWLAKWLYENKPEARVLIITDRIELDEQIEKIFKGVGVSTIYRTQSGDDLIETLNESKERIICSLIHKFSSSNNDTSTDKGIDKFLAEIREKRKINFTAKGDIYVFVDECHRSQSKTLHKAMKAMLPHALFIGFTGTPLLKQDKKTSREVFGSYIHTYKFDEAVQDGVVLELGYEARSIKQMITSPDKTDEYFIAKTRGLTEIARSQLKKSWVTMQKIFSSKSRLAKIVNDIVLDMETEPSLLNRRGNAILVAENIYQAYRFYDLFSKTELKGKCAVITSYQPDLQQIKDEERGGGATDKREKYDICCRMLADFFSEDEEKAVNKIQEFEQKVKKQFIEEPAKMRLLIVVDKLLTGFDAPPATYLYIDQKMQDHRLFQAICRVNRLYENKQSGYIVDYKDLFNSLESAIKDYTVGPFQGFEKEDTKGLLIDRLQSAKNRLDDTREALKALCENVLPPKNTQNYVDYFCPADTTNKDELKNYELRRVTLYKKTTSFIRAYASLANEMPEAGYSKDEIATIKAETKHYQKVEKEIKLISGDYIDLKLYEPAMRHLIDTYIEAVESEKILTFDNLSLIHLIAQQGYDAIEKLPADIQNNPKLLAEAIKNNISKTIIDKRAINPQYYEEIAKLLEALIKKHQEQALELQDYCNQLIDLAKKIGKFETNTDYPNSIKSLAQRALYDNLDKDEKLALAIDEVVKNTKKDSWRGDSTKEKEIKIVITPIIEEKYKEDNTSKIDVIFNIIKNQQDEY